MVAKVGGTKGGMGWEFEISKCKLFAFILLFAICICVCVCVCVCVCNCIALLCTKNYHNTTNQLYFNKINLKIIIPN